MFVLFHYIAQSFAYLDASSSLSRQLRIPARRVAEDIAM